MADDKKTMFVNDDILSKTLQPPLHRVKLKQMYRQNICGFIIHGVNIKKGNEMIIICDMSKHT